mgnify:CR=1 FL=1
MAPDFRPLPDSRADRRRRIPRNGYSPLLLPVPHATAASLPARSRNYIRFAPYTIYIAFVEQRRRVAEYEIDRTLYVAIVKILLRAAVHIQRILTAEKVTIVKYRVGSAAYRDRPRHFSVRIYPIIAVLKRYVLGDKSGRLFGYGNRRRRKGIVFLAGN